MNLLKTPVDKKQKIKLIVSLAFGVMSLIFVICVFALFLYQVDLKIKDMTRFRREFNPV